MVRTALIGSKLPKSLWSYAVMYSVWLKNRLPHKALEGIGKTPYEAVFGKKPDMSRAKEFGCKVFVKLGDDDKLNPRSVEGTYLGPSMETSDGFLVYWPRNGRVTVERNVKFLDGSAFEGEQDGSLAVPNVNPIEFQQEKQPENVRNTPKDVQPPNQPPTYTPCLMPSNPIPTSSLDDVNDSNVNLDPLRGIEVEDSTTSGPRCSKHIPKPSDYVKRVLAGESESLRLPVGMRYSAESNIGKGMSAVGPQGHVKMSKITSHQESYGREPQTLDEAKRRHDAPVYIKAVEAEHSKLIANKTWVYAPREDAKNSTLGVKWVFDRKYNAKGESIEVKACLVVCGDQQEYAVNYDEKFSSVMKPASKNIILAIAAKNGWPI